MSRPAIKDEGWKSFKEGYTIGRLSMDPERPVSPNEEQTLREIFLEWWPTRNKDE